MPWSKARRWMSHNARFPSPSSGATKFASNPDRRWNRCGARYPACMSITTSSAVWPTGWCCAALPAVATAVMWRPHWMASRSTKPCRMRMAISISMWWCRWSWTRSMSIAVPCRCCRAITTAQGCWSCARGATAAMRSSMSAPARMACSMHRPLSGASWKAAISSTWRLSMHAVMERGPPRAMSAAPSAAPGSTMCMKSSISRYPVAGTRRVATRPAI